MTIRKRKPKPKRYHSVAAGLEEVHYKIWGQHCQNLDICSGDYIRRLVLNELGDPSSLNTLMKERGMKVRRRLLVAASDILLGE